MKHLWFCTLDRREYVSIGDDNGIVIRAYQHYRLREFKRADGTCQLVAEVIPDEGFIVRPETHALLGF